MKSILRVRVSDRKNRLNLVHRGMAIHEEAKNVLTRYEGCILNFIRH